MEMKAPSQARVDWLKARRSGIGGSDVAAILGLSPWKTPLQVYLAKIATEDQTDDQVSEAAEWGNRLEGAVADKFQERHPEVGVLLNNDGIHVSKSHPFMLATPDRFIHSDDGETILECKTASIRLLPTWEAGEIPDAYQLQVQHYMAVLGLDFCWLACLVGGQRYFEFRVERNQELIEGLIKRESEFWQMVQTRTPPAVSAGDSGILDLLYPTRHGEVVALPESILSEIEAFEEAKINLKSCEAEKDLRANRIKEQLAGAEIGMIGKFKVSWKEISTDRIDNDALKTKFPEVAAQVTKTSSYRRFDVREVKEKK